MTTDSIILVNVDDLPQTVGPPPSASMIHSVRTHGVIEPVVLCRTPDGYEIVDGNRRVAALRANGRAHAHISAVLVDPVARDEITLALNINRSENLSAQTHAVAHLIGVEQWDKTQVRHATGMTAQQIDKHLRYLGAQTHAPSLFDAFEQGRIAASVMDKVSNLQPAQQKHLASVFSGRGKLTAGDIKALTEGDGIDYETGELYAIPALTLGQATRTLHQLAEQAQEAGISLQTLIDILVESPAYAREEMVF